MSKININDIDLEELDDEIFDELYEEDEKGLRKFKDGGDGKKRKKTPRRKDTSKNS